MGTKPAGGRSTDDINMPPVDEGEQELAQWLFEQSLYCDVLKLPEVKAAIKDRPGAIMDATLRLCLHADEVAFPRAAAVAAAARAGVQIVHHPDSYREAQLEIRRPGYISRTSCEARAADCGGDLMTRAAGGRLPWDVPRAERLLRELNQRFNFEPWDSLLSRYVHVAYEACKSRDGRATYAMRDGLQAIREALSRFSPGKNQRRAIEQIDAMLGELPDWPVDPRDPWAEAALAELQALPQSQQDAWRALLDHAAQGTGDKPAKKWQKDAAPHLDAVGRDAFADHVARWLPLLAKSRANGKPARIAVKNAEVLRGLAWFSGLIAEGTALPPALQALAEAAHAKVPGLGRRCVQTGNGAIWALLQWPPEVAAGRLKAISDNVKNRQTTAYIDPRLDELAEKTGVTRDALEEAALPDLGFVAGRKMLRLGDCEAELVAGEGSSTDVTLSFRNDKGKAVKSAPAAVKRDHAEALKQLKAEAKDAHRLLSAVKRRLESAPLDRRSWTLADFRRRYLQHGLAGTLARKLIWLANEQSVLFDETGVAQNVSGDAVTLADEASIRPWHAIDRPAEEVLAWRNRLAELRITQPFKQAHREIYVLTDAERATGTYSNRFAAHLIRQTQFRALAEQRGWKSDYLGFWDTGGANHPHLLLPQWRLRAEWWTDVADIGEVPETTSYGGGAMYLSTDQVRFYEGSEHDPLPLERVPPIVFSEVMRDVDLFVGVASVGNDPAWQDRGADGGFAGYWHSYSFGELGQTAQTRKTVLETLVPRLKIADRCAFTDKFLVIRGDVRTYKIHLGSGNILMEPNDQYLCIVPDRRQETAGGGGMFLPFEGDRTLSIILSKALLLAEDTKITDPTILSQIGRRAIAS